MEYRAFEHGEALSKAVAALLRQVFSTAEAAPQCVLLCGGGTPYPAYHSIAECAPETAGALHVGFTDERHVGEDSPDSNYGRMRPMLQALNLPDSRVLRVQTQLPLEDAATEYEARLRAHAEQHGRFALALLGLGEDGHTCSLFGDADLARAKGHWAIPVRRESGPARISVTPGLLEQVDRIVFMTAGCAKSAVVRQLLDAPLSLTAGKAVAQCRGVEVWHAES